MRLLHTTNLRLSTFFGTATPAYAILSHTWATEEVLFGDIKDASLPPPSHKAGWRKIVDACAQAVKDGYTWIWIDTCCIDKESSAELSEAINSMFKWYRQAHVCYAYLFDVNDPAKKKIRIEQSRWFERGWTLQELIAPRDVEFFDHSWVHLGTRQGYTTDRSHLDTTSTRPFADSLSKTTGIPVSILTRSERGDCGDIRNTGPLGFIPGRSHWYDDGHCRHCLRQDDLPSIIARYSVAQRMSWVARRTTTRKEDIAYCMLGIFSVNMPLLYGEGEHAFVRLQEEIIKTSEDQSILAFKYPSAYTSSTRGNLLARMPRYFADSTVTTQGSSTINFTAKALELELVLFPCRYTVDWQGSKKHRGKIYLAVLNCTYKTDLASRPSILIEEVDQGSSTFRRINDEYMIPIGPHTAAKDLFKDQVDLLRDPGSPFECDIKDSQTRTIRLLLKAFSSHTHAGTRPTQPALLITVPDADVKPLYTYPTPFTPTSSGAYIPSVYTSDTYSFYHGQCCSMGVICFAIHDSSYFFVQWGTQTSIQTNTFYEYVEGPSTGWCKILDNTTVYSADDPVAVPVWQKQSVGDYPPGPLTKDAFEENAKIYLENWERTPKLSNWDVKAWPKASANVAAETKCTLSIESVEFLGQNHLKMQVRFS